MVSFTMSEMDLRMLESPVTSETNYTDPAVSSQVIPVTNFDWTHPNYSAVWAKRMRRLARMRENPAHLDKLREYYRDHIAQFIGDWGVTVDPRNAGTDKPVIMPFVLFPAQVDFVEFFVARWKAQENGILVKSRDCGASWLAMAASASICLLYDDVSIGFGSATEIKVDRSGDPDSLFYKGRMFLQYLPRVFKGGWDLKRDSAHMRIMFRENGSSITGEAGDNIGRGGRKTIYVVDEFAHVERPRLVDASLSANTRCRIEMSSVNGLANTFAERARGGKIPRFDFSYLSDPRKTDQSTKQLYPEFAKFLADLDPVVKAAEYDCDFLASVEGVLIEQVWVQAAIGAAERLGITPSGVRRGTYDPADEGKDKNAFCLRYGIEVAHVEQWSGLGSDMLKSVRRVFDLCDTHKADELYYDADGMGGGVKGMAAQVNTEREKKLIVRPFRGSGAVLDPEQKTPGTDRKNQDYLENQKAQSWMALRRRFLETFRAVNGEKYDPAAIISLSPKMKMLTQVCAELSQPTRTWSKTGKLMVDKTPDGVASPNLADSVMMAFGYRRAPLNIRGSLLDATEFPDST